jgi:hypothetical protein
MTGATGGGFLLALLAVFMAAMFDVSGPIIAVAYLAAGSLLSYGTISLGARYAGGILAINSIALLAVMFASSTFLKLQTLDVLAVYICPQLLMMSVLVVFATRKHA